MPEKEWVINTERVGHKHKKSLIHFSQTTFDETEHYHDQVSSSLTAISKYHLQVILMPKFHVRVRRRSTGYDMYQFMSPQLLAVLRKPMTPAQ